MVSLRTMQLLGLAAFFLGVALAIFARRAPAYGWTGVVLVFIAAFSWALIETGDSTRPSQLSMFLTFLFVAPVAVTYSFRARNSAPDRLPALAAFAGSFIVALFLLFKLAGIITSLFLIRG